MSSPLFPDRALVVAVSGAAGQIAYSLLPMLAGGSVFGPEQRIKLHLLDIAPAEEAMGGVAMELQDSAYPLLDGVLTTVSADEAFSGIDVAVLLGGFPRKAGMERKDLISKNVTIYKAQGEALERFASRNVKVVVVANPANTNCLVLRKYAPSLPASSFSSLTRLDHDRLKGMLAARLNQDLATAGSESRVNVDAVRGGIIWGNHSATQVPDVDHATVTITDAAGVQTTKTIRAAISDDEWLNAPLVTAVQTRGAAVIKARKLSSAMSAARAAANHLRSWLLGTAEGEIVSMGIMSDGNTYGIADDLLYSFPVRCARGGEASIVPGLEVSGRVRAMLEASEQELIEERATAEEIIGASDQASAPRRRGSSASRL